MRLSVDLGPEAVVGPSTTAVISPDGTRLVFPARGSDGKQMLATRLLDQTSSSMLTGTENGFDPFFSPDGQWVGFFADGKLKKISVQGGAATTLCDAANPRAQAGVKTATSFLQTPRKLAFRAFLPLEEPHNACPR